MEHDERDDEQGGIEDVLESLQGDAEDFENFLARKAEQCASHSQRIDPVADLKDVLSNAGDAAVPSTSEAASTDETGNILSHVDVPGVAKEFVTEVTVHEHPIIGAYTTETLVPVTYDDEMKEVYFQTIRIAIAEMTAEQVLEKRRKNDRAIQLTKMQQSGLTVALEHLLKARTWKQREEILEADRKERVKASARATKKEGDKGKTGKPSAASIGRVKTKAMKAVDTFRKQLLMSKEATIKKLTEMNMFDSVVAAYIEKTYGEAE